MTDASHHVDECAESDTSAGLASCRDEISGSARSCATETCIRQVVILS